MTFCCMLPLQDGAPGIPPKCKQDSAWTAKPQPASTENQQQSPAVVIPQKIGDGLLPVPATKPKQANLTEKYDPEEPTEDEVSVRKIVNTS